MKKEKMRLVSADTFWKECVRWNTELWKRKFWVGLHHNSEELYTTMYHQK